VLYNGPMLMAIGPSGRIAAHAAIREKAHHCPACGSAVLLKRGTRVIPHFAHARAAACSWAHGETLTHLAAKASIARAFADRGLDVALEVELLSSGGDRRADVLVHNPRTAARVAIEIQHSALPLEAIERRTRAYAAAGVPVIWVATLDWKRTAWRALAGGARIIDRFAAAPWQRFAGAYHGALWFWADGQLWRGWLQDAWVARGTEETGWSRSTRWSSLTLEGPFAPTTVRIAARAARIEPHEEFALPAGFSANLVAPGSRAGAGPPTTTQWHNRAGAFEPRIVHVTVTPPPPPPRFRQRLADRLAA
jgi:hypothetical protein